MISAIWLLSCFAFINKLLFPFLFYTSHIIIEGYFVWQNSSKVSLLSHFCKSPELKKCYISESRHQQNCCLSLAWMIPWLMVGLAITRYEMESNGGLITTCNPFYQQDKEAQQARYIWTLCCCTYDFRWTNVRNWYDFNLKPEAGSSKNWSHSGSGTCFAYSFPRKQNEMYESSPQLYLDGEQWPCTGRPNTPVQWATKFA